MFDFQEFYEDVANNLPDNAIIAEVGLADGASAVFLAEKLLDLGKKFTFYWVDDLSYGRADQLAILVENMTRAGLGECCKIFPYDSLNASCRFPDNHFDFVFIDASHQYEFTKADIRLWWRKVKEEQGIIAGHDYNQLEVKQAVDEIIPKSFTRPPIFTDGDHMQAFEAVPMKKFSIEGFGLWWVNKRFFFRID